MNENEISNFLSACTSMFYKSKDYSPIEINICITDDVYKRRLELAYDENDKIIVNEAKNFLQGLNGTIALCERINDKHTVIISSEMMYKEDLSIVNTLIHELTHIHDFMDFAYAKKYSYTRDVGLDRDFPGFYFWTEYHAKRSGYAFYRDLVLKSIKEDNDLDLQLMYINETELPFQLNILKEGLGAYINEFTPYMYSIIQFLGRLSVWRDIFPDNFGKAPLELYKSYGNNINKLYEFIYTHKEFDDIKNNFNKLYELITNLAS